MEDARWDRRHGEAQGPGQVAEVLRQNLHLLPPWGRALDLACGRGANALLMARQGLRVSAWDLSPVAQECRYLVKDFGTSQSPKSTRQRDSRYCPDRPALITTPSRTLQ
ncbi:MAG: hypothetical protein C3L24_11545, partial [Candidatus Sedimenticola endophacoides]